MRVGVFAVVAVSAATVWFWPKLSAYLPLRHAAAPIQHASAGVPAKPQRITGRVVGITDGDTFTLLTPAQKEIRVRLAEIDAPEHGQPWGERAKQALSALIYSRTVKVVSSGLDRYGRLLGRVYVRGKDVNAELVRSGAAHAYREYLTDTSLIALENEAHQARRGLWSLEAKDTEAPWHWRHARDRAVSTRLRASIANTQCGSKRACHEMASCAEARFYLTACGVRALDGDGDGTPCEALCAPTLPKFRGAG
jgi:endonuclease YncB( thermonuclease family)